jgi:hypothetical protein
MRISDGSRDAYQRSGNADGGAGWQGSARPHPVAFYACSSQGSTSHHDIATKTAIARSLARLLGVDYVGELDRHRMPAAKLYVVPSHTLSERSEIDRLGIAGPQDFFGGVVPKQFIGTKIITHPLAHAQASAPEGWNRVFADAARSAVLPGCSAFTPKDALLGAAKLLERGSVRVKDPAAAGGAGQQVVHSMAELEAQLATIDPDTLRRDGLVLERNLSKVATHSIGQVEVGAWLVSYFGTQRQIRNGRGHVAYGGSTLTFIPGALPRLLELELTPEVRTAVEQALTYHGGVWQCFRGTYASRCNYDVVQGTDDEGRWRSGVLEQSWRIGGASGAEIAALHAFKADPCRRVVRASAAEVYGEVRIPAGAEIQFDGVDEHGDRLVKYVGVEHDVHP